MSKRGGKGKKRTGSKALKKPEATIGGVLESKDGAEILKEAANEELMDTSERIVKGLANKAARGNSLCAKMLLDLSAGRKVRARRGPSGLTYAQELALDPPWKPPAVDKEASSPPFAPFA